MIRVIYQSVEDFKSAPATEWENGTIFCEHGWLQAVTKMDRGEVGVWLVLWNDEPAAIAPMLWRKTAFGKMAFLPPLTPYWGLAWKSDLDPISLTLVLGELVKHCTGWRIALAPEQTLLSLPFPTRTAIHTTQIILPKPKEQLWHDLAASCRQKIRSAQNEELTFVEGEPEELALLMAGTFQRRKVHFPLDGTALTRTLVTVLDSGLCHIMGIRSKGGSSLSMRMVARDKRRKISYDLASGSADGLRGGAGNLLLWEEIVQETGIGHTVDLVGTGVAGVAEFKRSFGGVEKHYAVVEMFGDKVAEMRYRLSRRLGMLK